MGKKRRTTQTTLRRSKGRVLFVWLMIWSAALVVRAGEPHNLPSQYYSVKNGLSSRMVTAFIQDHRGFLWIGTQNGLNRFDGYEFITFGDSDADFPLTESNILKLGLYQDNRLLICYENNFIFFELLDTESFETQKVSLLPQDGIKGLVRDIALTRSGEIFVLSLDREATHIYHFRNEEQAFAEVARLTEPRLELSSTVRLLPFDDGSFLVSDSHKGLRRLSAEGTVRQTYALPFPEGAATGFPETPSLLHQDKKGRIWVAFRRMPGLFLYEADTDQFRIYQPLPQDKPVIQLWEDDQSNLLVVQSNDPAFRPEAEAIYCILADDRLLDFNHLLEVNTRIVSICSRDFFQDIFIGLASGFKTVRNNRSRVATFLARNIPPDQQGAVMRGITGDEQGYVYFAREYFHWYKLDPLTGVLDTILLYDEATGAPIDISCSHELIYDPAGYLWGVTCQNSNFGYLIRYDLVNCNAQVFSYPDRFTAFTRSHDGSIWLTTATAPSLVRFDPVTCQFDRFSDHEGYNLLANYQLNYLIESQDHTLWIGTTKGLIQVDPLRRTARRYESDHPLPVKNIYVLSESRTGQLWIGGTNGLTILDPATGRSLHYDQSVGLASNIVCGLVEDEKGHYWISTFNGLSYFDPEQEQFYNFFSIDGFSHDEFNRFSFYRDQEGRYYFGGINGVNAFFAEDLLVKKDHPSLALSKIVRYNSQADSTLTTYTGLADLKEWVVSPYEANIELHFMLPDYVQPEKNQFKVWLEGLDKQWSYLGTTRYLLYNTLPAGRYTLHVLAADPNGNWGSTPLKLDIRVKQIFYKSWWFILCLLLLTGLAVYLFSLVRLKQKLRVERLRTRLSSDLHDEVSGLLSSIAMQSDVLQMMTEDNRIKERLINIGEISRKAMTKMSDVIWSIDSRKDRVEDLLQRMQEHADDVLLPLNIRYNLHIDRIDRSEKIPVDIRQELFFIFKEAINNIGKHSQASRVDIHFGNTGNGFEMIIRDNGNGQVSNHPRTGQGLDNLRMRAQRINADLSITNQEGYTVKVGLGRFT